MPVSLMPDGMLVLVVTVVLFSQSVVAPPPSSPPFNVGVSISDVTGPAADVHMMGYGNPFLKTSGIHMRLYSRAFIVEDDVSKKRIVFVSVDSCWISTPIKRKVIEKLETLYGGLYTEANVCLSGTHTHSGPGGYDQYLLFLISSLGFVKQSFDALVDGIALSIQRAHESMAPGRVKYTPSPRTLLDANVNRSPTAYLQNPEEERAKYPYDVEKNMILLRFEDSSSNPLGMISWFPVHPTSMGNKNTLISGDNKGYASQLFEREMAKQGVPNFVAAFANTNLGDVSPNIEGAFCLDTGLPCDAETSTCNGKAQLCQGRGPGKDNFESTKIIAERQFNYSLNLYLKGRTSETIGLDYRFQYVDMSEQSIPINASFTAKTCKPALGYSFAAGTRDAPGVFDFTQGTTEGNLLWDKIRNIIKKPSKELIDCQAPKPILIPTGEIDFPYAWQPTVVDTQIFRIGIFTMINVPGEFSTMAGRRLIDAVAKNIGGLSVSVITGLSNTYADYVTTFEEYQVQRYEGASTIFGPYTLHAYIQQYTALAQAINKGSDVEIGVAPPDLLDEQISLLPPVIYDWAGFLKRFGQVLRQPDATYSPGSTVQVIFVSANPRNNLLTGSSFLTVEKEDGEVIFTDKDWETTFLWKRQRLATSQAIISWNIPLTQASGTYRIRHFGYYKPFFRSARPFSGITRTFQVV